MLKLREAMKKAGVLGVEKIRERIAPITTFEAQAAWWLAEIRAGRIVNSKTRKPMRANTIDAYSTAIAYLNGVIGNNALAALDNSEAQKLVSRMKSETSNGGRRFDDKTIVEFFRVFKTVIASAKDEKLRETYPRDWDLAYIALPRVNKREQHRPTFTANEISFIVANVRQPIYKVLFALLAGSGLRIGKALALEIRRHVSVDCSVVAVRQQRDRWGNRSHTSANVLDLPNDLDAQIKPERLIRGDHWNTLS